MLKHRDIDTDNFIAIKISTTEYALLLTMLGWSAIGLLINYYCYWPCLVGTSSFQRTHFPLFLLSRWSAGFHSQRQKESPATLRKFMDEKVEVQDSESWGHLHPAHAIVDHPGVVEPEKVCRWLGDVPIIFSLYV